MELKGYSTPEGNPINKEELWKDDIFYEQDYFAIYILKNLHVTDESGTICTPIIKEIEVKNSGYVCTWNCVFWIQGFAILNDTIFFISIGEDVNYYCKRPVFHKLDSINIGKKLSYTDFIKTLPTPIEDIKLNKNIVEW